MAISSTDSYPHWETYLKLDEKYPTLKSDGTDQLMIYRKNSTTDQLNQFLSVDLKANEPGSDVKIVSMCGNCDNSLLLLTGANVKTFIGTEGVAAGNTNTKKSGMQGEKNGVFYCSNLKIQLPPELLDPKSAGGKSCSYTPTGGNAVKVAVFDTGLARGEVDMFLTPVIDNPCIRTASQGWNFTVPDNQWDDDNPSQHGSSVTRFIIEQVINRNGQSVQIVPVKIHNSNGVSDLYSILCGFAYAKNMGAKIINASFGYYAPIRNAADTSRDFCLTIFRKFIKDQLTDNNILLIAAAGNLPSATEITELRNIYPGLALESRDLGQIGFYPASFARENEFTNVIAVTTVDPGCTVVSPRQNFSPSVVDIGVQSDQNVTCEFINPRTDAPIAGSSFATPIATGLIASNYHLYDNMPTKANIIDKLQQLNGFPKLVVKPDLNTKIKGGIVLQRK
jgi:subtilisin family serine protease